MRLVLALLYPSTRQLITVAGYAGFASHTVAEGGWSHLFQDWQL